MFMGRDMFGDLVVSATVRLPSKGFAGFEKFVVGITDVDGRRPAGKISLRKDRILLEGIRLTKPQNEDFQPWEEVQLAKEDLSRFQAIQQVQLTMRVDAQGKMSATARVVNNGKTLAPFQLKATGPQSQLDIARKYAAGIYVEGLPKPVIGKITPHQVLLGSLNGERAIDVEVFGVGFGPDAKVELIQENGTDTAARVSDVSVDPHNTEIKAKVSFVKTGPAVYSLKLTTQSQTAYLKNAIRLE